MRRRGPDLGLLAHLRKQGVRGLIVDLRFNTGGLLTSTLKCEEPFVGKVKLASIRDRRHTVVRYAGQRKAGYLKSAMVCLINGTTTKGGEIFADCLQAYKRAVIMGERTRGYTALQTILPLGSGREIYGEIEFSWALIFGPSGKNLTKWMTSGKEADNWGVVPDKGYAIKLSLDERSALSRHFQQSERIWPREQMAKPKKAPFKDRQLQTALAYLRHKIDKRQKK